MPAPDRTVVAGDGNGPIKRQREIDRGRTVAGGDSGSEK